MLICHRALWLPGRGDAGADLIMQHLSAQSLGYYLHRVLLRLGPKKTRRTAVSLWKLFSSVWLWKMNLHQSFHGSLPPTPSPLISTILSEAKEERAGPGEHPRPALFLCPVAHPENAKCFIQVAKVGAVHRLWQSSNARLWGNVVAFFILCSAKRRGVNVLKTSCWRCREGRAVASTLSPSAARKSRAACVTPRGAAGISPTPLTRCVPGLFLEGSFGVSSALMGWCTNSMHYGHYFGSPCSSHCSPWVCWVSR